MMRVQPATASNRRKAQNAKSLPRLSRCETRLAAPAESHPHETLPMKPLLSRLTFVFLSLALLPLTTASSFAAAAPRKVLVVTVTTGFRHSSIPTAEKILSELAKDSGKFTVDFVQQPPGMPKAPSRPKAGSDDAAMKKFSQDEKAHQAALAAWMPSVVKALEPLSPANLKKYDAVLFASTTGDLPLPDKQGFLDWIGGGKAFIGVHAATDTFHEFPPFIAMLGGSAANSRLTVRRSRSIASIRIPRTPRANHSRRSGPSSTRSTSSRISSARRFTGC
jgi:hypothetical protein